MNRTSHHEQDDAFGQVMLTLRTSIGLTQASLAEHLGVSRRAVGEWEAGNSYPKAEHLKKFIALAIRQHAFAPGREGEEVRELWRSARQRVLLDEAWLTSLLSQAQLSPAAEVQPSLPGNETREPTHSLISSVGRSRVAWGDAVAVPTFYGREWELDLLSEWVVEDRCRVVSILGLGGIGKSALAVRLMHQLVERFEVVIWRSVRNAPTCEAVINDCLQVLAPQALGRIPAAPEAPEVPANIEQRLNLLLECLRSTRVLLVLDNLETLLEEGDALGRTRAGYEDYGDLLRRVAETAHQSCLLFTSREKPSALGPLEGSRSPVRVLGLARLNPDACEQLLVEKDVRGTASEQARLIEAYTGNPLALKIVGQTIVDLFDGEIGPFLEQGALIFGGVRELLAQQFNRLSVVEQSIMFWLAIMRVPATFDELAAVLVTPVPRDQLLEGVEALRRRSLVERGNTPGSFTLQSVVLEYVTARLIDEATDEIHQGHLARLIDHNLTVALAREYVRQTQERLIVAPILERLHSLHSASPQPQQATVGEQLEMTLNELRTRADDDQGYGPANLVALLRQHRDDLRGLDLSELVLRSAYLQGVEMQDASLSGALIRNSVFTGTFGAILSVAVSANGAYLAACSRQGDVRMWSADDYMLRHVWLDFTDPLFSFALSPDGLTLAGVNWINKVKLWHIDSGRLLWSSDQHSSETFSMLFTPDGRIIATSGINATVQVWDSRTGIHLQELKHPIKPHSAEIPVISCSPDGQLLASGDTVGFIYLWALNGSDPAIHATLEQTIAEHTKAVTGLAFSPDGRTLASASWDGTVKLWDVPAGGLREILPGNRGPMSRVTWSPDGRTLACGGHDQMIWLWDVSSASYSAVLRGHSGRVTGLAFTSDSRRLLSGSSDGTLRIWDVPGGQVLHVMQGHTLQIYKVHWSPDGTQLVNSSSDQVVTIYDLSDATPPRLLRGHSRQIRGLTWSPDGRRIASSDLGNSVRIWDADSGAYLEELRHPDDASDMFNDLDWSPDGRWLAASTRRNGVLLWDMIDMTSPRERPFRQFLSMSDDVAWSPDGTCLACAETDGNISVWDVTSGGLLKRLGPQQSEIAYIFWSPDGRLLVSASRTADDRAYFVWDVQRAECLHAFGGPSDIGIAPTWGTSDDSEDLVVSGSSDGKLRWWDIRSGECVRVCEAHQGSIVDLSRSADGMKLASCGLDGATMVWDLRTGEHLQTVRRDRPYERLNITGIKGLTEEQKATLRALGAIEVDAVRM